MVFVWMGVMILLFQLDQNEVLLGTVCALIPKSFEMSGDFLFDEMNIIFVEIVIKVIKEIALG